MSLPIQIFPVVCSQPCLTVNETQGKVKPKCLVQQRDFDNPNPYTIDIIG
jgi:hypothetical protein